MGRRQTIVCRDALQQSGSCPERTGPHTVCPACPATACCCNFLAHGAPATLVLPLQPCRGGRAWYEAFRQPDGSGDKLDRAQGPAKTAMTRCISWKCKKSRYPSPLETRALRRTADARFATGHRPLARQPWESPTHASSTIEVRLQGRRPLTETHAQRKTYLTEGLQGACREQRHRLLGVIVTQILKTNIHVRMHASQTGAHGRRISKIDLIKHESFIAQ